jgi:exodeoxyribonuclease VII large subunit
VVLHAAAARIVERKGRHLAGAARTLQAVSPLATLGRGFAVLTAEPPDGTRRAVTSIRQASPGDSLTAHLHDGALELRVEATDPDNRLPKLPDEPAG